MRSSRHADRPASRAPRRRRGLPAGFVLVALALVIAGCGGGGEDERGDDAAAVTFKTRSERLCRQTAADLRGHVSAFATRVDAAVRDADPVVLRQETLRFFDDVERTFTVFYGRAGAIAPPGDAADWERRTDQAADGLTALITRAGDAVESADLESAGGLAALTGELGRVAAGVARAGAATDPVLRRYDVQGCSAAALGAALTQQATG